MECVFIFIINKCVFINENFLYLLSFEELKVINTYMQLSYTVEFLPNTEESESFTDRC